MTFWPKALQQSFLFAIALVCVARASPQEVHAHGTTTQIVGKVDFPISCSKLAQGKVERGLALLHSFLFDDAEEQFKRAGVGDPTCPMAFWAQAIGLYRPLAYQSSHEDAEKACCHARRFPRPELPATS